MSSVLFTVLIYWALRLAPPRKGGWVRFIAVHVTASFLFSALHVGGMILLREAIYAGAGRPTASPSRNSPTSTARTSMTYAVRFTVFWLFQELARREAPAAAPEVSATFDIRDGPRTIRARIADIAAVASAGNYVEVLLATAATRRTLHPRRRGSRTCRPRLRAHASVVAGEPRARIRLIAEGSGDFKVELDVGAEAPLSRRFPEALKRLRDGLVQFGPVIEPRLRCMAPSPLRKGNCVWCHLVRRPPLSHCVSA